MDATQATGEIEKIKVEGSGMVATAAKLAAAIKDEPAYQNAMEYLVTIKQMRRKIVDYFKPLKERTYAAWKQVCKMESEADEKLASAEAMLKAAGGSYVAEQDRIRRQEAEKAAILERKRAEDQILVEASNAQENGDSAAAEAILAAPVVTPPPPAVEAPKAKGVQVREKWSAEVYDLPALIKAVAAGAVPVCAVAANGSELDRLARALKKEMNYPGVRVHCENVLAVRSGGN